MGIAVPGAISAKLVHPDKKILAITGDAGFLMNVQEFETAYRLGTNFVTLIFNDCSYGLIKWKQDMQYGHHQYVDFTNPDFVKMAESFHAIGYRIEKTEDLLPTLKKAFQQDKPVIHRLPRRLLRKHETHRTSGRIDENVIRKSPAAYASGLFRGS